MALAVDGFLVLQQIGGHAELFEDIRADVNKQAIALLLKQIAKADLAKLRKITAPSVRTISARRLTL